MKVALIHDWLTTIGGAEKVLESLTKTFPANLYTLVKDPKGMRETHFEGMKVKTSFIQKLPFAKKKYRSYLPFFPLAIEQFDLTDYDLIISSSHSIAKGVLTHADQLHICYCHTPMRYAWDLYQQYLRESRLKSGVRGAIAKYFLHHLRMWDAQNGSRVNVYVANSNYVARRIEKIYQKEALVIHPPVDVDYFSLKEEKEDYYITASRFVPYKKIDLIVEAFGKMPGKKLVVVGDGPDRGKIEALAKGNVEFLGYQSNEVLREKLQKARGFVFAALEDFGILPVEAQSCGTPVIAYGKGGALETVVENETGLFFEEQTPECIVDAIHRFEQGSFDPIKIRKHAETFHEKHFQAKFKALVEEKCRAFQGRR